MVQVLAFSGFHSSGAGFEAGNVWVPQDIDDVIYDSGGWWSSAAPTRMYIPETGWYMIKSMVNCDDFVYIRILVNGVVNTYGNNQSNGGELGLSTEAMTIMHLRRDDYIEFESYHRNDYENSHIFIWRLPTPMFCGRGTSGGSSNPISLTPQINSGFYWDASQPTRATIPATGNYFVVGYSAANGNHYGQILKNGSSLLYAYRYGNGYGGYVTMSGVYSFNAGDYLQITNSTSTYDTQFAVIQLKPGVKCCGLRTSSVFLPHYTWIYVPWDIEDVDTSGFHTGSSTEIVVPTSEVYVVFNNFASRSFLAYHSILEFSTGSSLNMDTDGSSSPQNSSAHGWLEDLPAGATAKLYTINSDFGSGNADVAQATFSSICLNDLTYLLEGSGSQIYNV